MYETNYTELILTCEKHPSQIVTHICCLDNCLSALCVKCMKSHNLFHKQENVFPELETVEDVREFCCEKLLFLIENYSKELEKIRSVNSTQKPDENMQKLSYYREKMIAFVNNYFNALENEYEKRVQFLMNDSYSFGSLVDYFRKMIAGLEDYLKEIKYKCTLDTLQHILVADYQQEFDNMKAKNEELCEHFTSQRTVISFNEGKIQHIMEEMEKIASLQSYSPTPVDLNKSNSMSQGNKMIFETMRTPITSPVENSLVTVGKTKTNSTKGDQIFNFQIKNCDFFNKTTSAHFLHFFQQKSKFLHIYNLEELRSQLVKEYKLEMNIDFKIPRWHRSITIPNGSIYLFGGVVALDASHEATSNLAYTYDYEANTLIPIEPMIIPRSGHGVAYLNEKIYCVGGFTDENVSSVKCERYNLQTSVWEEIADLNSEANNACLCSFQSRFLYKFGGKLGEKELNNYIERYCPTENIWEIVHVKTELKLTNFSLLSSSACCQINRSQIFVFGGTYQDYSQKSSQSFILEIFSQNELNKSRFLNEESPELHIIKCFNERPLPFAEGFWNNNPIVFESELYCLQNIPNRNNPNIVYNDRRRILKFDSKGNWIAMGS